MSLLHSLNEKFQITLGFFTGVLREYIYENTGLKLIALLIALVLWGTVSKQEHTQVTLKEVPIDYANTPPNMIISNDDVLKMATVRVRGPKDTMENLRVDTLKIRVDLNSIKQGERVIPLLRDNVVVPDNIEVIDVDPQRIHLTVEPIIRRDVKVVPRFGNNMLPDYEVTSQSVNPSTVTIQGPESHVNNIADAPTETISLAEHRISFIERPSIDIKDPSIDIIGSPRIEVQVQIGQIRTERKILNVPVRLQPSSSEKVSINPVTITVEVEGPKSVVDGLVPAEISAIVNVEDLPDTSVATPNIVLPPSVLGKVNIKQVDPPQIHIKRRR